MTRAATTPPAADAGKSDFLLRTYLHLFGAIGLFALVEVVLFSTGAAESIARDPLSVNWLVVLGGFILVSWFASIAAHTVRSPLAQYLYRRRAGAVRVDRAAVLACPSVRAEEHGSIADDSRTHAKIIRAASRS